MRVVDVARHFAVRIGHARHVAVAVIAETDGLRARPSVRRRSGQLGQLFPGIVIEPGNLPVRTSDIGVARPIGKGGDARIAACDLLGELCHPAGAVVFHIELRAVLLQDLRDPAGCPITVLHPVGLRVAGPAMIVRRQVGTNLGQPSIGVFVICAGQIDAAGPVEIAGLDLRDIVAVIAVFEPFPVGCRYPVQLVRVVQIAECELVAIGVFALGNPPFGRVRGGYGIAFLRASRAIGPNPDRPRFCQLVVGARSIRRPIGGRARAGPAAGRIDVFNDRSIRLEHLDRAAGRIERAGQAVNAPRGRLLPLVVVVAVAGIAEAVVGARNACIETAPGEELVLAGDHQIAGCRVDRHSVAAPAHRPRSQHAGSAGHGPRTPRQTCAQSGKNRYHRSNPCSQDRNILS